MKDAIQSSAFTALSWEMIPFTIGLIEIISRRLALPGFEPATF